MRYSTISGCQSFFKCYTSRLNCNIKLWKQKFPGIQPYYAVKCNNHPYLITRLASLGCSFDCASLREIQQVQGILKKFQKKGHLEDPSGLPPIIFANPIKLPSHLKKAKQLGVAVMTVDCPEELEKIAQYFPTAQIILRIAVDDSHSICQLNKKFGLFPLGREILDKEREFVSPPPSSYLIDFFERHRTLKHCLEEKGIKEALPLVGVSFHVGSGCFSAHSYQDGIKKSRYVFDFANQYGIQLKILDIGGGFIQKEPLLTQVSKTILSSLNQYFDWEAPQKSLLVIAEPGRFIAANVYDLYVSVIGKKKNQNQIKYYVSDSVYGSFNCKIFDYATFQFDIKKKGGETHYLRSDTKIPTWVDSKRVDVPCSPLPSTIFGATCDSLDVIIENVSIPELEIGDYLHFHEMGAYTLSAASEFNGIPKPSIQYL